MAYLEASRERATEPAGRSASHARSDVQKEIRPDDFVNLVIPIYSRHFSESDLDGLIAFYSSPLGQRVTHEMPTVASECVVAGQEWGRKLSEQILARAKQKGYQPRS